MRLLTGLFKLGLGVFVASLVFVLGFTLIQAFVEPAEFDRADVIVVLGAGMDPDGTLHEPSILRVQKGVTLFEAGAAPRMHFTGGRGRASGPSAGDQMARLAESLGVPQSAMTSEGFSQSTLQNALFSQEQLNGAKRIILVTEGFHLPRSWVSFTWAGDHDLALAHSTRFRNTSSPPILSQSYMVVREVIAWWFNLVRIAGWELAGLMGVDSDTRNRFLY